MKKKDTFDRFGAQFYKNTASEVTALPMKKSIIDNRNASRTRSMAEEAFDLHRLHTKTSVFENVKKINVPEK